MFESSGPPTSRKRILGVEDDSAGASETAVLERAKSIYGWVPNTIRVMARGSVAAEFYLDATVLNGRGSLTPLERELVAITTAWFNHCEYSHLIVARLTHLTCRRPGHGCIHCAALLGGAGD